MVRRSAEPVPGAARTVTTDELHEVLPGAQVVFLALALSPATTGIIGAAELALMDDDAWLVNVARGGTSTPTPWWRPSRPGRSAAPHSTSPIPSRSPRATRCGSSPNCIVTPHTADTLDMIRPLLASGSGPTWCGSPPAGSWSACVDPVGRVLRADRAGPDGADGAHPPLSWGDTVGIGWCHTPRGHWCQREDTPGPTSIPGGRPVNVTTAPTATAVPFPTRRPAPPEPGASFVIDCAECEHRHTDVCDDCVVSLHRRPPARGRRGGRRGEARAVRLLEQAGLVPGVRHSRRVG